MVEKKQEKQYTLDEQIFLLADLTRRVGGLHEVQVTNLKMWPLVFLCVKSSTCEYHHEKRKLYFTIGAPEAEVPFDVQERLKFLEKSCQWLLGEDIKIAVRTQTGYKVYGSFDDYPDVSDSGGAGTAGGLETEQE